MEIDKKGLIEDKDLIPHIYWDAPIMMTVFKLIRDRIQTINEEWIQIGDFNDIEKLKGRALDMFGANFKVDRGPLNDAEYRRKINFEISSFTFRGSVEEIKKMLAVYFNLNPNDFTIYEETAKFIILVPQHLDKLEVYRQISKIKGAGIGIGIDDNIYVNDFTLAQLKEKDLQAVKCIKLKRPIY